MTQEANNSSVGDGAKKFFLLNKLLPAVDYMFPRPERQICSNCERYFKTPITPGTARPFFKVERVNRKAMESMVSAAELSNNSSI